jgi:metallophosphoesterase (TIGR03768 family)
MAMDGSKKTPVILAGDDLRLVGDPGELKLVHGVSRREFLMFSLGTVAISSLGALTAGCGTGGGPRVSGYPIDSTVVRTTQRVLSFPMPPKLSTPGSGTGLCPLELSQVSQYGRYGYGEHTFGGPLQIEPRFDLMPPGYADAVPARLQRLATFFAMSDVHITDKEAPNQLIYLQQADAVMGAPNTSIYSPVMPYTTQVLDAAIQTLNALHQETPFDFGISLGDVCNSAQYNELRWYIDVLDGKVITPSSGSHLGAGTVDYQRPFQAAGLDRSIPWYQVLGNHDHFFMGSIPIDATPSLGIREAYTAGEIWAVGDLLTPTLATFPCLVDSTVGLAQRSLYMGVIDGSTLDGAIKGAGAVEAVGPPVAVAADPSRRPLLRTEWIQEFFDTTTRPVGHGLGLVDRSIGTGFACYCFFPRAGIPLKVIVLDDTQSEDDGSHDIHGHGFLDATRWAWLQAELAAGQASNQLMIIAAHAPIAVAPVGSELEWWEPEKDPNATTGNAVTLTELVATLQSTPNLLMWIAGHRHLNTIKAFQPALGGNPENGFWQVETSSLRDFPQQFRTFEIYLHADYSVSVVTANVDPAVAEGTPAATSRAYSIAAQQIAQTNLRQNFPNVEKAHGVIPVEAMDPSRPQNDTTDLSIRYGAVPEVPYCASYNAELFKQLSPTMIAALQALFPGTGAA